MRKLNGSVRVALIALALAASSLTIADRTTVDAGVEASFAIDADPTGTPCSPVDSSRSVATGASVSVALCLLNANQAPVNGGFTTATLRVGYTSPLSATDNAGNPTSGLGGNPDWNSAGLGGAAAWDCNLLNSADAAPSAAPSPANLTCGTTSFQDQAVSATAHLATLTFNAPGSPGISDLTWDSGTSVLAGFDEGSCDTMTCAAAQIEVTGTGPTATPVGPTNTPLPPTATRTPCTVNGATCTPVLQDRNTITPTPSPVTPVVDETPPAGETTVPGEPTGPGAAPGGEIPGGGPGGVITLPDTGSGGGATPGRTNTLATAVLSLIAASSLAMGLRTSRRAVQKRRIS
jgi:hypothetical protein